MRKWRLSLFGVADAMPAAPWPGAFTACPLPVGRSLLPAGVVAAAVGGRFWHLHYIKLYRFQFAVGDIGES